MSRGYASHQDVAYPKLGIIAGGGDLPARIIDACQKRGQEIVVIALQDITETSPLDRVPHQWIKLGEIGKAIELLKQNNVVELVMAGKLRRPSLSGLRPDAGAAKLLARLGTAFFAGDDKLLSGIISFLEEEGFRIIGVDEIINDILTPIGLLGQTMPDKRSQEDIPLGARVARALGELDIGQAVIVQRGVVLGVEGVEGTDALIERCGALKFEGGGGVLVKVKKPAQERRADLPTIGIHTVENMFRAGLAGIAVEAGGSIIIDQKAVARRADQLGIFVVGFTVS